MSTRELVINADGCAVLRTTTEIPVSENRLEDRIHQIAARKPLPAVLAPTLLVLRNENGVWTLERLPRLVLNCAVTFDEDSGALVPEWTTSRARAAAPLEWCPPDGYELWAVSTPGQDVYLLLARLDGKQLFRPPVANVFDDGRVCRGDPAAETVYDGLTPLELHTQALYSVIENEYNADLGVGRADLIAPFAVCWDPEFRRLPPQQGWECSLSQVAPNIPGDLFDMGFALAERTPLVYSEYWAMTLPGLLKNGGSLLATARRQARDEVAEVNDECN